MSTWRTIWENTDGCAEQYRCTSALYTMSVISQRHSIIYDWGMIAPGHVKDVVGGLNSIEKHYMYQLMSNVQHPGFKKLFRIF